MGVAAEAKAAPATPAKPKITIKLPRQASRKTAVGATLDARSAAIAADAVSRQIKGAKVVAVQPNGNMRPVFETNALLVVEPARAENLRVGDIVTYEHPKLQETVVQRVLEKRDGLLLGDGGKPLSSPEISSELMRVVVILYVRDGTGVGSGVLAASGTTPSRANQPADGVAQAAQVR